MSDENKKKSGANINEMILGSLKPRTGKETTKWLAGLTEETVQDAAEAAASEQDRNYATGEIKRDGKKNQLMVGWIDHLFDCFQQYEYDFNRSVGISELSVTVERPTIVSETVRSTYGSRVQAQFFKGRLSTRAWTLVIRAQDERIEGFILPVDKLFSFGMDSSLFPKFLIMEPAWRGHDMVWNVDGVAVGWDEMRDLAKKLFASLIKVAKGEATEDQPFSLKSKSVQEKIADVAPVPKPQEQPQMLEPKPELQTLPQNPFSISESLEKVLGQAEQEKRGPAPMAGEVSFVDACEHVERAISQELVALARSGAQAFAKQDMAAVQKNLSRTNRLKELQKQITLSSAQWRQEFLRED